ncbi:MAG: transposase [Wenzhouxiangellaceae bacterium]|nr:transposase [Wenzhouxiangellaceae bacterium]
MPNYRRDRTPGGTYFFTVALRDRSSTVLLDRIDDLRAAVRKTRHRMPFEIIAWAVLPEHMHCLWKLPEGDADYATRWRMIKTRFSRCIPSANTGNRSLQHRSEKGIWQRRYWEHRIRDESDLQAHADYIHFNPVKHGLCAQAIDWPHSTFTHWVAAGRYAPEWGISEDAIKGNFGE